MLKISTIVAQYSIALYCLRHLPYKKNSKLLHPVHMFVLKMTCIVGVSGKIVSIQEHWLHFEINRLIYTYYCVIYYAHLYLPELTWFFCGKIISSETAKIMYVWGIRTLPYYLITISDSKTNDPSRSTNITQIPKNSDHTRPHINTTKTTSVTHLPGFSTPTSAIGEMNGKWRARQQSDLRLRTNHVQSSNYLS